MRLKAGKVLRFYDSKGSIRDVRERHCSDMIVFQREF
jgi:hypothetical protein